jgi:uncharacterized protein YneF (UPF0154 family)
MSLLVGLLVLIAGIFLTIWAAVRLLRDTFFGEDHPNPPSRMSKDWLRRHFDDE